MKLRDFINQLPKDGWNMHKNGSLRRCDVCPIVCMAGSDDYNDNLRVLDLGLKLGLNRQLIGSIMHAADWHETDCHYPGTKVIRRKLLDAMGFYGR